MLRQAADGVFVHQSEFVQTNAIVVQGASGVLLIDPGVHDYEIVCLANDIHRLGQAVVAGFSTHPHWDHLLWHDSLGSARRYGTAAAHRQLSNGIEHVAQAAGIPEHVPLDLLGLITGLPARTVEFPWDGPPIRIIEHQAHAPGHAALLIEDRRVLVAGDMLSDILIPMLDFTEAADPIENYLAGLRLLEDIAACVDVIVPGHGSIGGTEQFHERIDQDRTYVRALCDAHGIPAFRDARLEPSAYGADFLPGVHARQCRLLPGRLVTGQSVLARQ